MKKKRLFGRTARTFSFHFSNEKSLPQEKYGKHIETMKKRIEDLEKLVESLQETIDTKNEIIGMLKNSLDKDK